MILETLRRVVDHDIGTEALDQFPPRRRSGGGYFCAEPFGDLDGKCPDASGSSGDEDAASRLELQFVTKGLKRR